MFALGPLAFAAPWMLLGLALLPVLWWLLRVTPPSPRRLRFPAVRLLLGLQSREETPASSPLWLVLLRLAAVAALTLALAHPLFNPTASLPGSGPVVLVVDDGWASAPDWNDRIDRLQEAIDRAERDRRAVALVTTAPPADARGFPRVGLMRPEEARTAAAALAPKPWPVDRPGAAAAMDALPRDGAGTVIWFSDGLARPDDTAFAAGLQRFGPVTVRVPERTALAKTVRPGAPGDTRLTATVRRPAARGEETTFLRALATDGRLLAREAATFSDGAREAEVGFDLPLELRNEVDRIVVESRASAGSVALLDERWRRRPVGLLSDRPLDSGPSLLSELHYVERALGPFAEIGRTGLEELGAASDLPSRFAVIVMPDGTTTDEAIRNSLENWIERGGMVIRFAGPRLAQSDDDTLTPVVLRRGGRTLSGAMLWTEAARLAPFDAMGPFHGLPIPDDVTVSGQVLAEPSLDLGAKTWARLTDGTPLVTAERRGDGWLVLFHTTANGEWSNLALSGLFVEMLRKTVQMSRGVTGRGMSDRPYPPISVLDGFGRLEQPPATARPIAGTAIAETSPGPGAPPGFYGREEERAALNLGPALGNTAPLDALPSGVGVAGYDAANEVDLKPALLLLALLLLLADTVATLALRGLMSRTAPRAAAVAIAFLGASMLSADPALAQRSAGGADDARYLEATLETRLAYVLTGDANVDNVSREGLTGLSEILHRRTAVEAAAPMGVDLARDELVFYPLLYWPITASQPAPDAETVHRLNRFMATGGTILFDLRDSSPGAGAAEGGERLRNLARGLEIPPLVPVPADHVLTKAFYLMQEFPGRWAGGRLWVERPGERANDGVARVVVGANDWAAAWAVGADGAPAYPVVPGGERQREMAYRFGVNLVMYTLTGSYKSDQVHVPAILERLGQ